MLYRHFYDLFAFKRLSYIGDYIVRVLDSYRETYKRRIDTRGGELLVGELANLIAAFLFVWPLWFLYQKLGANRKAAVEALLLSIVIRTACACFINANITLPLYAKAMSLPLDEVIRMVASVNPAIKDLNGFIILATIPFNVLKVGLNYIVGQLLFVRLRAAKIVPKAV